MELLARGCISQQGGDLKKCLATDAVLLVLFYILLVALKLWWVGQAEGPVVFGDEQAYKTLAQSLFSGQGYTINADLAPEYPPLYPSLLTLGFFFRSDWYPWLLRINVLVSSTVVFPIWWIARGLLTRPQAWGCVLLAALIPYHVVFPRLILSENLFLPLFLLSVYTILTDTGNSAFKSAFTGVIWGATYLTRNIFLPALPVLLLLWWIRPAFINKTSIWKSYRQRLVLAIFVLVGFLCVYVPWFLFNILNLPNLQSLVSLAPIGSSTPSAVASGTLAPKWLVWSCLFASYVILMAAPYVHTIVMLLFVEKTSRAELFFVVATLLLTGAFVVIAASYMITWNINWEQATLFEGRYVMYTLPLIPILSFLLVNRLRDLTRPGIHSWRFGAGVATAGMIILLAYNILIAGSLWKIHPEFYNNPYTSAEMVAFTWKVIPWGFSILRLLLVLLLAEGILLFFRPFSAWVTVFAGAVIFYSVTLGYVANRVQIDQANAEHGRVLSQILEENTLVTNTDLTQILVDVSVTVPPVYIRNSLAFWNVPVDNVLVSVASSEFDSSQVRESVLLLTHAQYPRPLASYNVGGDEFYIYSLPGSSDELPPITIKEYGPLETVASQSFNVQPNGDSAFWMIVENAPPGLELIFRNSELEVFYGSDGLVTAAVPAVMIRRPGSYSIFLIDPLTRRKSNSVPFVIR